MTTDSQDFELIVRMTFTYQPINLSTPQLFPYTLHLADNALILAQRNSEWTGHGPVLEQDIAITNIALDLIGQARNLYSHAATLYNGFDAEKKTTVDKYLPRPWKAYNRELQEDDLAFLRDESQYLNLLLAELPKGDWAVSVLRQFFLSVYQSLLYRQLQQSGDAQLAAIAEKSLKEVAYHTRWSGEWVIRLGDGTEESNRRINAALENLWPFTDEAFVNADYEEIDMAALKNEWLQKVEAVFTEVGLAIPAQQPFQRGGKQGRHTEYLGPLLAEMQYMQRTYPNAVW